MKKKKTAALTEIVKEYVTVFEKLEKKMSGNKCAYYNCGLSARNNPSLRLSHFPVKDTARCKRWILHSVCIPEKNTRATNPSIKADKQGTKQETYAGVAKTAMAKTDEKTQKNTGISLNDKKRNSFNKNRGSNRFRPIIGCNWDNTVKTDICILLLF
ncbi:hypothetical protein JTB14_018782 [Gonioctena quinquepunctata]|nr:hypothetical protein JTB14_018782 [Gonioctena quinquepunctata]